MKLLLLLAWFLLIASASFWLPAYKGDLGGEGPGLIPVYAVLGALAAVGVREVCSSVREAVEEAIPAVAVLAVVAVAGLLQNLTHAEYRGGPLYLYFGIALWASWAGLVLSTAVISRTKWTGLMGIGLTLLVAVLGLFLFTAHID
jgi:hypothetical protein